MVNQFDRSVSGAAARSDVAVARFGQVWVSATALSFSALSQIRTAYERKNAPRRSARLIPAQSTTPIVSQTTPSRDDA
jgi:hypothetical protein